MRAIARLITSSTGRLSFTVAEVMMYCLPYMPCHFGTGSARHRGDPGAGWYLIELLAQLRPQLREPLLSPRGLDLKPGLGDRTHARLTFGLLRFLGRVP